MMMKTIMRRRLSCCSRDRNSSFDFDKEERITTYDGLESCIAYNQPYENESGTSRDGFISDSFDDDDSSCSSSKDGFGSFTSKWIRTRRDDHKVSDWELSKGPCKLYAKEKHAAHNALKESEVEEMKEKFANLLVGEDITGGRKGVSSALALSNAITHLAALVFGEMWKLEPLAEERKGKWRREMEWLLSPTNYMVQLVPAKQNGANGLALEIMTPQARADIQMNLPALQKLDCILIETLDSMVNTEFWYSEVGSRSERKTTTTKQGKRWWLPLPQVPSSGLSDSERKKLSYCSKIVYQVLKAARAINENVLHEMPVPEVIHGALSKSGKENLGEELYKLLSADSTTAMELLVSLNSESKHSVLEVINKLEAAILAWKEKITTQLSGKSPVRASWSFIKNPTSEADKIELLLGRAVALVRLLKTTYPNLPQTFLDATKVQYGQDVGHSILEAYSRVLGNLAFSILSRIGDILQEDALTNQKHLKASCFFPGITIPGNSDTPNHNFHIKHSIMDQTNSLVK